MWNETTKYCIIMDSKEGEREEIKEETHNIEDEEQDQLDEEEEDDNEEDEWKDNRKGSGCLANNGNAMSYAWHHM